MPPIPTLAIFAAVVAPVACGTAAAQTPGNAEHARAELIVGVEAVAPGASFPVGVRMTTDPGWHVYWKYPGTAGLPTTVDWHLPDGVTVGPLQYPTPREFDQPGGIVGYGYEGSALLTATVTAPDTLTPGDPISISADVAWLVCADVCIPGSATVEGSVPVAASSDATRTDPAFVAASAALPVPADRLAYARLSRAEASLDNGRCLVELRFRRTATPGAGAPVLDPAMPVQWMPAVPDGLIADPPQVVVDALTNGPAGTIYDTDFLTRVVARFTFDAYDRGAAERAIAANDFVIDTVLTFTDTAGRRHGVAVPVPLTESATTRPAE